MFCNEPRDLVLDALRELIETIEHEDGNGDLDPSDEDERRGHSD